MRTQSGRGGGMKVLFAIDDTDPKTLSAVTPNTSLTIIGKGCEEGCGVEIGGDLINPSELTATRLKVRVAAADFEGWRASTSASGLPERRARSRASSRFRSRSESNKMKRPAARRRGMLSSHGVAGLVIGPSSSLPNSGCSGLRLVSSADTMASQ